MLAPLLSTPSQQEQGALIREARHRVGERPAVIAAVALALCVATAWVGCRLPRARGAAAVEHVSSRPAVNLVALAGHGRIAFVSRDRLWAADGTRHSLRPLPAPPGLHPISPEYSPDGRWLAYLASPVAPRDVPDTLPSAGGGQVWIAHGDGSGARRVPGISSAALLGWSPTRDVLAVGAGPLSRRVPFGERTRLLLVSPGGPSRTLLHGSPLQGAVWSPDGRRLAVVSADRAAYTLATYPVKGGAPTTWLSLGPHDRLNGMNAIVFVPAGWWRGLGIGLWIFGDGMVHNNDETPLDVVHGPGVAPRLLAETLSDGTTRVLAGGPAGRLALVADVSHGMGGGRVAWDRKQVQLCTTSAPCRSLVPARSKVTLDPVWSPDGKTLAFVEAPDLTSSGWSQRLLERWYGRHRLRLYDVTTGTLRTVPAAQGATAPAWSASGKSLLYVAGDGLWLLPMLSSKPVEIASPLFDRGAWPAYYGQMAWTAQFAWAG